METDVRTSLIQSPYFDTKGFQRQLDIIKKASEEAQRKIDYYSAHDEEIVRAIDIVEDFLRKKHRLCYGGQAINAHLPSKYKFYDPEYTVPDYDFFTPDQLGDIKILIKDLRKAGFTDISAREGMHEGTIKIYVNYVSVADMTQIDPKLYRILSSREFRHDGISYLDANSLRMLMYLELSRPRGEVDRWSKVYERLALFNEFVNFKKCKREEFFIRNVLTADQSKLILNYIIDNKRIFAGADLVTFYEKSYSYGKQSTQWLLSTKKPVIFLSPDADADAKQLKSELEMLADSKDIEIKSFESHGVDLIPNLKMLKQGTKILVYIIQQVACHSYYNIPLSDTSNVKGGLLRIASMDTLITLFFSLGLVSSRYIDVRSIECLANEMVEISIKARKNSDKFPFPFISLKCAGYQTSLSSLVKAKVERIKHNTRRKKNIQTILMNKESENMIMNVKKNNGASKKVNRGTVKRSLRAKSHHHNKRDEEMLLV